MAGFSPEGLGGGVGSLVGLAGGIYSAIEGSNIAKKEAQLQQEEIGTELQESAVKFQAMRMSGQRQMLQNIRNAQMARSMALSTAQGQGAQFSSGLAGAYGGISGQAGVNTESISQNLQIGTQLFGLNTQLSGEKEQMAGLQSEAATNSAIGGLFNNLGNIGGSIGKLAGMIPFG